MPVLFELRLLVKKNFTTYKLAVEEREFARIKRIEELAYQLDMTTRAYLTQKVSPG